MSKNMFAGANSPMGFVDFFDNIMVAENARWRYFLKGSSGSGKSTFMKKIAAALEEKGLEVERFHCANDVESLDAVANHQRGICFMDATFPHSRDPQMPIIIDKIIDFSGFIDGDKIANSREEIAQLTRVKRGLSEKAAGYFGALGKIYRADRASRKDFLIGGSINKLAREWAKNFQVKEGTNRSILNRQLFLSAVTPDGLVSFAEGFFSECTVYGVFSEQAVGVGEFLEQMRNEANIHGVSTESFHNPFAPDAIEHLYLPEINIAFATLGGHFGYSGNVAEKIDLTRCISRKFVAHKEEKGNGLFDSVLDEVIRLMKNSRSHHFGIERLYSGALDYGRLDEFTEQMIGDILL
ncbi:MAG: hypothetical protein FWB98_01340 [Defluviitaleaceae bacterium]|nr:hypothetical protein [Defluviitaleaceae bacterium]